MSSVTTFEPNSTAQTVSPGGNTGTSISLPAGAITGVAYLLCDSVAGNDPRFAQAGYSTGFVLVQDSAQGWEYFSVIEDGWLPFAPQGSDVLVATNEKGDSDQIWRT